MNPESVRPQLATLTSVTPSGVEWVHEVKFDGYRVLAWRTGDQIRLISRNGLDWTSRFSQIAKQISEGLPAGTAVDGEIVVFDENGRSDFGLLQHWLSEKKGGPAVFVAFDLLVHDGASIMDQPLIERKRILKAQIHEPIQLSELIESGGEDLFESACALQLEGIISKRKDAPYVQGRTKTWLKRKCINREEFAIGGFTEGKGTRGGLGAILLGQFNDDGTFDYCGKVGTGFDESDLQRLYNSLKLLTVTNPPFKENVEALPRNSTWVKPTIIVEIKYAERTRSGLIRQGVFLGEREDKKSSEVHREMNQLSTPKSNIKITHPDRILFEDDNITKAELAAYYESVADLILPLIVNRPLAVVRCPDGTSGECFFQKHVGAGMPPNVGEKVEKDEPNMIVVKDRNDLMSLVQFGVIELHPWAATVEKLEQPDTMIFDLDPGPGINWVTIVQATLAIHERLESLNLPAYVKTSGGKGFHVVVPIHAGDLNWVNFKAFAKAFAEDMDKLVPDVFVTNMAKAKRNARIFLDYLRNGQGATSVAAFSVRARPNAPVSMPIAWTEIRNLTAANTFTIQNSADWLPVYDPKVWEGYSAHQGRITKQTWKQLEAEPAD